MPLGWRDPNLWVGVMLGALATGWAVFAGTYVPFIDWAAHLGLISVLAHGGDTGALEYYVRSFAPSPYLLFYALTALWAQLMPVDVAAKVVLVMTGGALGGAASYLAQSTGRDVRMGWIGPLAMFGLSMEWGFGSFVVATPFLFFAFGAVERHLKAPPERINRLFSESWPVMLSLALLYLGHGFLFLVGSGVIVVRAVLGSFRPSGWRALWMLGLCFVPSALLMLPTAVALVRNPTVEAASNPNARWVELEGWSRHVERLGGDLLARGDQGHWMVMYVALGLWVGWGVWSAFRRKPVSGWGVEIYAVALLLMFLFGPMTVNWPSSIWLIYPRFGVIAALALFLVPRPDFSKWGWLLAVPALVLVVWNAELNARGVRRLNRVAQGFDGVRAEIPKGAKVLALTVPSAGDPPLEHHVMGGLYSYFMVDGAAYVAFLFDKKELPVSLRTDRSAPKAPPWNAPWSFDPGTHGVEFDYLVLRGRELVERTERSRLFKTVKVVGPWVVFRRAGEPSPQE